MGIQICWRPNISTTRQKLNKSFLIAMTAINVLPVEILVSLPLEERVKPSSVHVSQSPRSMGLLTRSYVSVPTWPECKEINLSFAH